MFISHAQLHVFIACLAFGGVFGLLFIISKPIKNTYIKAIVDTVIFCLLSFIYFWYSQKLQFGNFRFFMPIGVLIGILMCGLSFNKILETIFNLVYKTIKKDESYDGRKKQKN